MENVLQQHIEMTPGVVGGKPCIAGTRIAVQHVAIWHEHMGISADEIVDQHPGITLADVHAALAYYFDHLREIEESIQADEKFVKEMRERTPSLVREKLRGSAD
ncbi:MAG: DUF433 domain-containing protein [Anaerolineae bacterium]